MGDVVARLGVPGSLPRRRPDGAGQARGGRGRAGPRRSPPRHAPISFLLADSRARLRLLRGDLARGVGSCSRRVVFESIGGRNPAFWPGARRPRSRSCSWASRTRPAGWRPRSSSSREPGARRGRSARHCVRRAWSRAGRRGSRGSRKRSRSSPTHRPGSSTPRRGPSWELPSAAPTAARRRASSSAKRLELATICGAEPLAARAETELLATGARPRRISLSGVDSLTPSERRVAQLAAEGPTNRQSPRPCSSRRGRSRSTSPACTASSGSARARSSPAALGEPSGA